MVLTYFKPNPARHEHGFNIYIIEVAKFVRPLPVVGRISTKNPDLDSQGSRLAVINPILTNYRMLRRHPGYLASKPYQMLSALILLQLAQKLLPCLQ